MQINDNQKQVILNSFLFKGCKVCLLYSFLNNLIPISFIKNQTIYSPHEYKKAIAIILSGEVCVKNTIGVPLNILKTGDCFGAAGIFQESDEYVSNLIGLSSGELVFISDSELIKLFELDSKIAINYIMFLSGKIKFLSRKIQKFTAPSAEIKVSIELLEKSIDNVFYAPNGYAEIARILNIGRASLYRVFELLENKGIIEKREKNIIIKDKSKLENLISEYIY